MLFTAHTNTNAMSNDAITLEIEKEFSAPVDELVKAWTEPDQLKQWWKPAGAELKNVDNDVKEGGKIRYEFESDGGETSLIITGEYKEVKENEKLTYTWNWEVPNSDAVNDSDYMLHIGFDSLEDDKSKISVKQENFKDQEAIQPHREGWDKALNDLASYLDA